MQAAQVGSPATIAPAAAALPASQVAYNATAGLLTVSGLNHTLACPAPVLLTWAWAAASGGGGSAAAGR